MVSLMTQDDRAARQFVASMLGRLATESTVLQRSLHAFLANGCNITQTAEALGTHRNTLLRRLERAQDLLPVQLADHRIQIAAALELLIWNTPLNGDEQYPPNCRFNDWIQTPPGHSGGSSSASGWLRHFPARTCQGFRRSAWRRQCSAPERPMRRRRGWRLMPCFFCHSRGLIPNHRLNARLNPLGFE
ncbi:hypothetical protein FQZ97_701860 [compost metagenome]